MSVKFINSILLSLLLLPLLPSFLQTAHADYYKYTDKSGAVCITNNLASVPARYRSTMKVIREETLAKKDKATRLETPREPSAAPAIAGSPQEKADVTPSEPLSTFGRLSARFPWFKPALFVSGAILLFLIVRKLADALPSALLAKVIYLAFFLGAFVFVYKSYADHLSNSYLTFKTKLITMFEKANRREAPEPGGSPLPAPGKDPSSP